MAAREAIKAATDMINIHGSPEHQDILKQLIEDVHAAIEAHDDGLLNLRTERVKGLTAQIWWDRPESWVDHLIWLQEQRPHMLDQAKARDLFGHANDATETGDIAALRNICQSLRDLLPRTITPVEVRLNESTILRSEGR
jgi:hypothetical protein